MNSKTDATAPADDITLPAIQRAGSTLYVLNASGTNLWSAQVQPGRTDDDQRLPDAECERIAAILADRASTSRAAWIDVSAHLPEPGQAVLLDIGRGTPLRAVWAAKHTIQAGDEAPDEWAEYVEADDMYYCPEGWYEWNEHEETHWAVSATPLRWLTIPVPAAVDVGDEETRLIPASNLIDLLPGTYYMDLPDGGDTTVMEQLRRMAEDAARYRWLRDSDWSMFEDCWLVEMDIYGQSPDDFDAAIDAARATQQGARHG